MKKFFAMLLSLVMILSLSVPAFAAETDTVTSTEENKNTATQNVTASYTPSSTEDTTATITGIKVTVDGVTYESGTVTLTPNSGNLTITVIGTNLQNHSENNKIKYLSGASTKMGSGTGWSVNDEGTEASRTFTLNQFTSQVEEHELGYCNDGSTNYIGSGVSIIYDTGSTEPATITGVSLSGTGVTYDATTQTYTVAHDATDIVLTVTGTNFANLTTNYQVKYCTQLSALTLTTATVDVTANTVTYNLDASGVVYDVNDKYEIKYSSDGGTSWNSLGVYVIYDDGISEEDKAVITGLSITVDGTEYTSGTAVITPNTQSIIFTVTGTKLKNATESNCVMYSPGQRNDLTYKWTISDDGTSATMSLSISDVENITTAHELSYTNDMGATWSNTGIYVIYQSKIVSVDITWGAMSFTYDDTVAEGENGWTCAEGANKITVVNNSTVAVIAAVDYTPADGYDWLGGYFEGANGSVYANMTIDASGSFDFYLILASDKPEAAFSGTVGTVTVTITEGELPATPPEE